MLELSRHTHFRGFSAARKAASEYVFAWADFCTAEYNRYEFEWVDWCTSADADRLAKKCREFMLTAVSDLDDLYPESFDTGYYPDAEERLDAAEISTFREAAGIPIDYDGHVNNDVFDVYEGLVSVIRQRLSGTGMEAIQRAAELFNWTMYEGLVNCTDYEAYADITIVDLEEFGPLLIRNIVGWRSSELCIRSVDMEAFEESRTALEALQAAFERPRWTDNLLAVKLFLWVAERYRSLVETE